MKAKIHFYYKINGAFKDEINSGDNVIAQSSSYSRDIVKYDLSDEYIPLSHSLLTSIHAFKSYFIGHYQGLQVEFSGNSRAYSTRSVFELYNEDLNDVDECIGSLIASLPQMPLDGYSKSNVKDIPQNLEVNDLQSIFRNAENQLQKLVEQAFYTEKKLYVRVNLNRENAYAGNLQKNEYLLSWLYCIDQINKKVRPYVHFAFGIIDSYLDYEGKSYLVFFYDENDVKQIPKEGLNVSWEEDSITPISDVDFNLSYEKFIIPNTNDYNLAKLYNKVNAEKKKRAVLLDTKYKVKKEDRKLLLEIYNNDKKDEEKAKKKLLEYIKSEQSLNLIHFLTTPYYETKKLKEELKEDIVNKLLYNNFESLEEIINYWEDTTQIYSYDDPIWSWDIKYIKFSVLSKTGASREIKDYLKKLKDCKFKEAIIRKVDELKPQNIEELQQSIEDSANNRTDFLSYEDLTSFLKEIIEKKSDTGFIKEKQKCIEWLQHHPILSQKQHAEMEGILRELSFTKQAYKFIHTHFIVILCFLFSILLICSNIISYHCGKLAIDTHKNKQILDTNSVSKTDILIKGKVNGKDITLLVNDTCRLEQVLQSGVVDLSVDSLICNETAYTIDTNDTTKTERSTKYTAYFLLIQNKINSLISNKYAN